MNENETTEVQLFEILKSIWAGKYIIGLLLLIGSIIGFTYATLTEVTQYSTTSSLVINKEAAKIFYEDAYTEQDLSMYEKILNTYVEISKSNLILNQIALQMNHYTIEEIQDMVSITTIENTFFLKITVKGDNPNDITQMANLYAQAVTTECYRIMPVGNLVIVDAATVPTTPLPSNVKITAMVGALLGCLLGILIVRIRALALHTKITTPAQLNSLNLEIWSLNLK